MENAKNQREREREREKCCDDLHKIHIKCDTPESIMIPNGRGSDQGLMQSWTLDMMSTRYSEPVFLWEALCLGAYKWYVDVHCVWQFHWIPLEYFETNPIATLKIIWNLKILFCFLHPRLIKLRSILKLRIKRCQSIETCLKMLIFTKVEYISLRWARIEKEILFHCFFFFCANFGDSKT